MAMQQFTEIDFDEILFVNGAVLGSGAFGLVRRAIWNDIEVAVKTYGREMEITDFLPEVRVLHRIRHPNIVKMYGACTRNPTQLHLVMEYMENGSLWDLLHCTGNVSYRIGHALKWGAQIASAVVYLHSINMIHRDLKPHNLLLSNQYRLLKVCDFGTAADLKNSMTNNRGSARWMAPEVFKSTKYNDKCDVYSFGIILWEMVTRKKPFADKDDNLIIQFQVAELELRPPIDECIPTPLDRRIMCYWHSDPNQRPSVSSVYDDMVLLSKIFPGGEEPLVYSGSDVSSQTVRTEGVDDRIAKELEQRITIDGGSDSTLRRKNNTLVVESAPNAPIADGVLHSRNNFVLDNSTTVALLRDSNNNHSLFVRIDLSTGERGELICEDNKDNIRWEALRIQEFSTGKALIAAFNETGTGRIYLMLLHCNSSLTSMILTDKQNTNIELPGGIYVRADIVKSADEKLYLYVYWHSDDESETIYNIVQIDINHNGQMVQHPIANYSTFSGAKFAPFILRQAIFFLPYRGKNSTLFKIPFGGNAKSIQAKGQSPPQYMVCSKPYLHGNNIFFFYFNRQTCSGSLWQLSYCEDDSFIWKETRHSIEAISDNPVLRVSRDGIAFLHCEFVDKAARVDKDKPLKATAQIYKFDLNITDDDGDD